MALRMTCEHFGRPGQSRGRRKGQWRPWATSGEVVRGQEDARKGKEEGGELIEAAEPAVRETVERMQKGESAGRRGTDEGMLREAYARCGEITKNYAKTFHLATRLLSKEKREAVWAIYVWCRRTDELVDGPNAPHFTASALDRWEERLHGVFEGNPYDVLDYALADTVARFPVPKRPFEDMVQGMRMDLERSHYESFDQLREYCYRVAGTVGLMVTPVMGLDGSYSGPLEPVCRDALALGTANQLTNVLRDVGEDAKERGRVYLPASELRDHGLDPAEVARCRLKSGDGSMDPRWRSFMARQIDRARWYFSAAERSVGALDPSARWPVWCSLILYRGILSRIEHNGYDNFDRRAFVPGLKKLLALPVAYLRSVSHPSAAP